MQLLRSRRRVAFGLVALFFSSIFTVDVAFALPPKVATITVNTPGDSDDPDDPPNGLCSLREAINNADNHTQWNNNPDCKSGGTVRTIIKFGTSPKSNAPVSDIFVAAKFGELSINSNVTLAGPVTLHGPFGVKKSRILHVTAGAHLSTEFVSLRNGISFGDSGGAILDEGDLSMVGGAVEASEADRGAGVAVYGSASISFVEFIGNTANVEGGALWLASNAPVTIDDCTINANRSSGPGGGIFQAQGTGKLSIARTSFSANRASGSLGDGGALYGGGVVDIESSVFTGNLVEGELGGAGIYFSTGSNVTVDRSAFDTNSLAGFTPSAEGGAIHYAGAGTITITRSNFLRNKAWVGGAMYFGPGTVAGVANSTLAFNVGDTAALPVRDGAGGGAAIFADDAFVGLGGVTLRNNSGLAQVTANGPSSHVDLGNTVLWSQSGVLNCDGSGTFSEQAPTMQNIDRVGGSCPGTKLTGTALDVFQPTEDYFPPESPPTYQLKHVIWPPKGTLIGAGDPAACVDPLSQNNFDERNKPRVSCDIGAVEH